MCTSRCSVKRYIIQWGVIADLDEQLLLETFHYFKCLLTSLPLLFTCILHLTGTLALTWGHVETTDNHRIHDAAIMCAPTHSLKQVYFCP